MSSVTIQSDCQLNDPSIRAEFPFMARIVPADLSFYTALGYSVLYRLSCVSKNLQKEARWKIIEYSKFELKVPNIDRDIKIPKEIEDHSPKIEELLNIVSDDKKTIAEKVRHFKTQAIVICRAFQRILAAIFAKSNKISEAEDILAGKSVSYLNQYYFNNFASSLSLKITIRAPDEAPIEAIDQTQNDRINVDIYCYDKRTHDYAIIKHQQDFDYICGKPVNTNDWPFVILRKKSHVPVSPPAVLPPVVPVPNLNSWQEYGQGNINNYNPVNLVPQHVYPNQGPPIYPGQASPAPPALPSTPIFQGPPTPPTPPTSPPYQSSPHIQGSPPYQGSPHFQGPPMPPNPPGQHPSSSPAVPKDSSQMYNQGDSNLGKISKNASNGELSLPDQLNLEQTLINCLSNIFTSSSPLFTESESKTIKKNLNKIRDHDKKLMTKELKNLKESLSNKCRADHECSEFVIFKSCKKRHCKKCLGNSSEINIICDCRNRVAFEDLGFLLEKQISCSYCKNFIEDISQAVFQPDPIHRSCFVNLLRNN